MIIIRATSMTTNTANISTLFVPNTQIIHQSARDTRWNVGRLNAWNMSVFEKAKHVIIHLILLLSFVKSSKSASQWNQLHVESLRLWLSSVAVGVTAHAYTTLHACAKNCTAMKSGSMCVSMELTVAYVPLKPRYITLQLPGRITLLFTTHKHTQSWAAR